MLGSHETSMALRASSLFAGTDSATADRAAELGRTRSLASGEVLIRQGDPGDSCFLLLHGRGDIAVDGVTLRQVRAGEWVGEMAVLDGSPRSATVTAAGELTVLELSAADFEELLDGSPVLRRRITQVLMDRLRESDSRYAASERPPEEAEERPDPLASLTPAERRVCDQVARGLSNAEVAAELHLSRHTVESHLKRVFVKLDVRSRVHLAALVLDRS